MKNISLVVAAIALASTVAFAQGDRNGNAGNVCFIEQTGEVVAADSFFSLVHQKSQKEGCAAGKLFKQSNSGRLYISGRKVAERLSGSELEASMRQFGVQGCSVYVCNERGPNGVTSDDFKRNGTPRNDVPVGGGGSGW